MNYFGVDKRVKVVDKMTPRDIDRSKLFNTKLHPVVKRYKIYMKYDRQNAYMLRFIGVDVISYVLDCYTMQDYVIAVIEATDGQIELIKLLNTFIRLQEIR